MMVDLTVRNGLLWSFFSLSFDDIHVVLCCVTCKVNAKLLPALGQVSRDCVATTSPEKLQE